MNKLVVLLAVVGAAVAKPSILGAPLAYHSALIAPAAVSHTSRVDLNHSPILSHYGYGAPLLHAAPWTHVAPLAALPPHHPATILSPHGVPLDTIDVVAARAQHYQAKALASHGLHYLKKRSILAAPLAYSAVWAPSAVSHQSRVDWNHHGHLYAPLAYSAPLTHWGAGAYGVHPW